MEVIWQFVMFKDVLLGPEDYGVLDQRDSDIELFHTCRDKISRIVIFDKYCSLMFLVKHSTEIKLESEK